MHHRNSSFLDDSHHIACVRTYTCADKTILTFDFEFLAK